MGAITSAVIAIVGVVLGWITIEIACKPCLEKGRDAIDRNLNPDYDPDDDILSSNNIRAPLIHASSDADSFDLNPNPISSIDSSPSTSKPSNQ